MGIADVSGDVMVEDWWLSTAGITTDGSGLAVGVTGGKMGKTNVSGDVTVDDW